MFWDLVFNRDLYDTCTDYSNTPTQPPIDDEMAPKSPAKRVTRARAAAKKEDVLPGSTRKPAATKVAKTTSTRKPKAAKEEELVEEAQEPPKKTTTRTITKPTTLTTAPRRRLKVTPLNPSPVEEPAPEPKPTTKAKKTSTRSKKAAEEQPAEDAAPEPEPAPTKTRARTTKATKATEKKAEVKEAAVPKTRGRPKRAVVAEPEDKQEPEPAKPTRQTRTRAAPSAEPSQEPAPVKPKAKTTKKVTFQDLPEDDKENLPVPAKKTSAKKAAPATGMRAKPVRKPSAAPKKTTAATRSTRGKIEKPAARALTPKKITQVNRPATPDESDVEDELSGAKTPVRDLSMSPKRNPRLAASMSPAKKLDFAQSLSPNSPVKATESVMMSPARRPPASPGKEAAMQSPLKELPKRGDFAPLFPSTSQNVSANTALMPSTQTNLLQSPKRVQLDASAFSQSAMKPKQSPHKSSLLQSPARRLFSPKKSTPATGTKAFADFPMKYALGTPEDIAITSHFRASVSPQRSSRVHRMSDEEIADELANDMDFDQSVLNVRSPLKVMKEKPFVPFDEETEDELDEDIAHAEAEKENEVPAVIEEMMLDSEVVQAADPADIAVVLPKNDKQAVIDEMVQDSASINTTSPSKIEVAMPVHDDEESDGAETDQNEERIGEVSAPAASETRRLSELLFHSERPAQEESSEDELAGDKTPARAPRTFRSSLTGVNARARLSTGIPSSVNRNIGFTPLAAQMSGWLAASPEKAAKKSPRSRGLFSPIAAQHIDGEVTISRQSTPQQKTPAAGQSTSKRQSFAPRMSLASSLNGTPDKTSYFDDQMASHEADENQDDAPQEHAEDVDMHAEAEQIDQALAAEDPQDVEVEDEQIAGSEDGTVLVTQPTGELTTDLIQFSNASDTAMVDFDNLAKEAEELHEDEEETDEVYGDENTAPLDRMEVTEMVRHTTAQEQFAEYRMQSPMKAPELQPATVAVVEEVAVIEEAEPAAEVTETAIAEAPAALEPALSSPSPLSQVDLDISTPVQRDFSKPRFLNTVVSKVPLRPEGHVSPIKMPKKRARSLSNVNQASPPKRVAFTPIGKLTARAVSDNVSSPSRSDRSTAPSPAVTTPGQMSFAVNDFGDSTLDGIDLPEEEDLGMDFEISNPALTPATAKLSKTVKSTAVTPRRTPLKQLGQGVLSGAVVFVDVHTTEGADASGVYIDLLTQMGARCVKDWRWNPRASINVEDASASGKVGITHVVYKDGGKRTVEKVRDAKGEVWCVGVRWVLE